MLLALLIAAAVPEALAGGGKFELTVIDGDTGQPIACRMHLKSPNGKPRKVRGFPNWNDHFVFPGKVIFELPRGTYTLQIERGPEYQDHSGHFVIDNFADDAKTVTMKRFVNMADEGWFAGDLDVRRPLKDIELLMQAEDLRVAGSVTWQNRKSEWDKLALPKNPLVRFEDRFYHLMAGEDARGGNAVLYCNLPAPIDLKSAQPEYPPASAFMADARRQGGWVDVEMLSSWDLPVWLAAGLVDSVQLANHDLCRVGVPKQEPPGKPRDSKRFPGAWGNGQWSQEIYYHMLNCGLRLPPTAGSGSGLRPNPLGYNRVYVYCGRDFSYEN